MEILRFALLGLGAGAVYMLAGQGLVLVYRGSGIINFAQGAMGMAGAFAFYELCEARDWPTAPALMVTIAASGLLGVAIHLGAVRPLRRAPAVARLLGPLALMAIFLAVADILYGPDFFRMTALLPDTTVRPLPDTPIGVDRLIMFAVGAGVTACLAAGFRWTKIGLSTSAVAEDQRTAASLGISPDVVACLNWALAGMLATTAAILTASLSGTLNVSTLVLLVLPGLAAALVGGFRSFVLTAVGAAAIGVAESEMARYVSTPGWAKSVPFLAIVAVLLVRGRGLPLRDEVVVQPPELGSGRIRPSLVVPLTAVALAVVWVASPSWVDAVITTAVTAMIVLSLVVVTGLGGQVSLAQYALAGMGAWIAARLVANYGLPFPVAVLAGVVGAVPIGLLVGMPALRARGVNLAIATLGLALVLQELILGNPARTGGSYGTVVGSPSLFGIDLDTVRHPERYATFVVLVLVVVLVGVANLRRGRAGRRLIAVRANERAAASLGIGVYGAKLYAFGLSAAIAAFGGILMAFRNPVVVFGQFDILNSVNAAMYAVIGGIGYVTGALVGALLAPGTLTQRLFDEVLGTRTGTVQALKLIGGAGALAALLLYPNGLAGYYERAWTGAVGRVTRLRGRERGHPQGAASIESAPVERVRAATLTVRDLTVRFGGVTAVDGVDITVRPGEVVGLIGPNGAGKTTLIDAVTGFVPVARGSVTIDDRAIEDMSASRRARLGIARSFQSLELFDSMTVRENLAVASDDRDATAYLTDLVRPRHRPLPPSAIAAIEEFGLVPDLDRRPSEIPFGRRRLVAIARAIASGPSVLLLDEPAAGLSRHESDELGRLVRNLASRWGIAVLIVEHDVGLVLDLCDRVTVLDAGRVIADGDPHTIRYDPAVIDAYLGPPDAAGRPSVTSRNGRKLPPGKPLIEAVELTAGYGALGAVRELDLVVAPGEIVALLGPNGAGKTTTLLTLAGELPPLDGQVLWRGQPATSPLHHRARDGLALITEQRSVFMQLTAAANLRLGRGEPDDALQVFPELAALANRRAGLLSGGEQQMLTLARALAARPSLLLADELSLGLAPLVIDRLFEALRRASDEDGLGVLLVEQHARRALAVADRVYVLNRGRVVLSGTAADLQGREDEVQASYLSAV
ncbi:MAG TPA: ATP-binding cassette domain-containing protein [Acidimicrobiales bacterium]|nr:ATP-binding cassette domain-containing protein [Acidimicrobiales bacterium]